MAGTQQPAWTASGVVQAPAGKVWKALVRSLKDSGYGTVTVDEASRSVSLQGGWWYRGVHVVRENNGGSVIQYQVYNIASGATRWLVPLVVHGGKAKLRDDFQQLLKGIGKSLRAGTTIEGN